MRLERPSRPRRKGSTQLPTSRFALVTVLGIRQDCSSRALGVHAEPDTASIERDNFEAARREDCPPHLLGVTSEPASAVRRGATGTVRESARCSTCYNPPLP